ncbi:MAG: Ig-like domain-containing protein [Planctomycetia bacterium]|nr:Ig-like domain-containing protein [Planctomycetia bacterium]
MKKTPKSNRSHRSSWMKKNLSANRKTTTFHLESLEPRQMLSGISFATVNLNGDTVESDTFQVTLSDLNNQTTSPQYVTMNIVSSSGKVINPSQIQVEGARALRTSTDSSTKVTSILYQMGFGTDYSVTVTGLSEGESLKVLFTLPGDKDGNGISELEHYEAYGEVLKGNGLNAQFVHRYLEMHGVDLTQNHFDTLWDMNGDGKFTLSEFQTLFNSTSTINLEQTITTSPDIRDLKVNGETPRTDGLVQGSELVLSGNLSEVDTSKPIMADVTVGGETKTVNLTELADSSGNFTWDVKETFDLTEMPEGEVTFVLYGGKCETAVNDPSANSWSFILDATAPAITATEVLTVNGQEAFEGKFHTRYENDQIVLNLQFTTTLNEAAFATVLANDTDGIYIDVVITNASGTSVFTATNYRLTKDNLTKKADEDVYVLGLNLLKSDTNFTDGEYTLTVTPHDLVGNTVTETTATLVMDSTAPVAADVVTTYTEQTNPGSVTADYYTDGTFSGDSADVTLGFANGEKGTIYYSLDGGENWLSSGNTFVGELTLFPTWQAGTNTIQYYLVDRAGNALGSKTEPLTWTCIINTAPVLSTPGKTLETDGLTQLEREGAEKVTVTLADQFTNDDGGAMTYENIASSNDRVTVTNNNGILEFAFVTLGEDEVSYSTTISVTAKDQYGETCTLTFELEYTKDNEAPQAGNVQIEDGSGNRLDSTVWNQTDYDIILAQQESTPKELWLTGTIEDISEIKSFTVVWGDYPYPVTNPAEDFTEGVFSYNAANKSFKIDITGIAEGGYSLKVYGADEHGNVTTEDTAQETTILVDLTAPTATIDSITVDEKSTTATVYTNDTTPTVTVVVSDADTDTWVQLWNGTTFLGSGQVANGSVSIALREALAEGSYTLTVQIVDGVGNEGASQECLVVVDTTKPVVGWNSGDFDSEQTGTETGEYYTINSSQKVILELTETNQTGGSWTITRNDDPLEYNADGLELILGTNAFTATYTDAAGNTAEESFVIYYNAVPGRTQDTLATPVGTYSDDGTVTVTIPKADVAALFTQDDSEKDTLTYELKPSMAGATVTEDGEDYVITYSGVKKTDTQLGTLTITATDSYGEFAEDYSVDVYKENLAPWWSESTGLGKEDPLKVTLKQQSGESISYIFDVPVEDEIEFVLEEDKIVPGLTFSEIVCLEGTVTFDYVDGKYVCTFTPNEKFLGTANINFDVTDQGYGPVGGGDKLAAQTIELKVEGTNTAPVWNGTEKPTIETEINTSVEFDLADYTSQFTDAEGEDVTVTVVGSLPDGMAPVDGQSGKYTFTTANYGVYTFQIIGSDGVLDSAPVTISIVVAGEFQIKDESLNVTAQETISAGVATTTDMTLAERVTTTSNVTLGIGSVLKAGTVLKVGTQLGMNAYGISTIEYQPAAGGFVLTSDYNVTTDMTTTTVVVLTADSEIAFNSLLKAGTNFAAETTVKIVSVDGIRVIYNNYSTSGTLLEYTYSLSKWKIPEGVTLESVSATFEENSCFASAWLSDDRQSLIVQYKPYQPDQDRSAVEVSVMLSDGTKLPVTISTEYETPIRFETRLVSTVTDTTFPGDNNSQKSKTPNSSILSIEENKTYYLEVWGVCDIPLYQEAILSAYETPLVFMAVELTIPAEVMSYITVYSRYPAIYKYVPQDDGSYRLTCGSFSGVLSGSQIFCGYDGYYERLGLYTIETKEGIQKFETKIDKTSGVCTLSFTFKDESTPFTNGDVNVSQRMVVRDVNVSTASNLRGTEAARETVVEGNGVYLSLVKDKTESEQTQTLRESEEYLTEWDSSWVELWVNTQEEGVDLRKVLVDLGYDANLFTATDLEYGSAVEGLEVTWEDGKIVGIGGDLSQAVTNEDGFVLLARVKLESAVGNGVAADNVGAVKAGLVLENIALFQSNGTLVEANTQVYVNTNIFPVVYDSNDDGRIDIDDLVTFAKMFGESSTDSTDPRVWAMDFDKSGNIDIDDLVAFAKNFGLTKADADSIVYPERFMEQWIGSMKIGTGDANVANLLETAIRQWETKLNEALQIDVQIIVKDLDDTDKILGQTVLVGVDENGAPNTAVVYLDDDALGQGWFVSEDGLIPSDQYDLYTVLLHELGHALGFNASYTGYTDTLDTPITYTDDAGEKHYLRPDGHVEDNRDDLMYFEINPGERKEISDLDAEILRKAREQGGVIGEQYLYALQGSVSDTVSEEVTSEVVVSTMMEESQWNAMLVSAVTEEVRKVEGAATDKAWETIDSELLTTDNSQRATTASEDVDWLGEDDSLESLLEEIATEPLSVKLEK